MQTQIEYDKITTNTYGRAAIKTEYTSGGDWITYQKNGYAVRDVKTHETRLDACAAHIKAVVAEEQK